MLKNIVIGILLTSSLFAQLGLSNFFKYSTAYGSFSLNVKYNKVEYDLCCLSTISILPYYKR